jgi:hypothetical protein
MVVEQPDSRHDLSAEVAVAVLGYLDGHPDAADTLDGIVRWWLPQQRYEMEKARIERVLEILVADGLLRREWLPGGAILYTLSKTQKDARSESG